MTDDDIPAIVAGLSPTPQKYSPLPPHSYLTECYEYDHLTGTLRWKVRPSGHFSCAAAEKAFNTRFAGCEAFTSRHTHGYRMGKIGANTFYAHRVAWKIYYGVDPDEIDHINGVRSDNRISNLRSVTRTENCRNLSLRKDSRSGRTGVTQQKDGRWRVRVCSRWIGSYQTLEIALAVRSGIEKALNFSERHGEKRHA